MRELFVRSLRLIDHFLNGLTMYRLVLYGLIGLVVIAMAFGAMGAISLPLSALFLSAAVLLAVGWLTSWLLATLTGAPSNYESSLISSLILFFLLPPPTSVRETLFVALASLLAVTSKYLLAPYHRHIFNPAALAVLMLGLTALYPATWWVATPVFLPFTLMLGLMIVRKLRRFRLLGVFLVAVLGVMLAVGLLHGRPAAEILTTALLSWPVVFFGAIMLTEPSTLPPRSRDQLLYGGLVGIIFSSQSHIGPLYSSPELALIVGNIFSYLMSPKYRWRLRLTERVQLSDRLVELRFVPDRPLGFAPGQYMDFTLPHARTDGRGNRRTFSLASSPTESELRLGIRLSQPASSFKLALVALPLGSFLAAGQLAGNFTLPADASRKLLFIAGGIGITPFRSMLKYLIDQRQSRDIILCYLATHPSELIYADVLAASSQYGVKVIKLTDGLTGEALQQAAPDYLERQCYISGPNAMVDHYRQLLREHGLSRRQIVSDYFSGY